MTTKTLDLGVVPDRVMHTHIVEEAFDPEFYLDRNEDVRVAGLDPWQHYIDYGGREGRDPAPWFSDHWYRDNVLVPLNLPYVPNPLEHWMRHGRQAGFTPSEEAEVALLAKARTFFDARHYLASNPDVAAAGNDPWDHFVAHGWREGRAPFEGFDMQFYLRQLADHAGIANHRNPLLHWVAVGREEGWPISEADRPSETPEQTVGSLAALVEHLEAARFPLPDDDVTLLAGSALFDPVYLAAQDSTYDGLDRPSAARQYLREAPAGAPDPSPLFAARFYHRYYGHMMTAGQSALVHYLRKGRDTGLPPSPEAAWCDVLRLRLETAQVPNLRDVYINAMRHTPRRADIVEDYVLHGVTRGSPMTAETDENFVRAVYGALVPGGIGAPAAFVARNAHCSWVYLAPERMRFDAELVRKCAVFDPQTYVAHAGLTGLKVDPAVHFVTAGVRAGLPAGPEFDTVQYMVCNPDLAKAPIVPALHFDKYGRGEGRKAFSQWADAPGFAQVAHDPDRPTILMLTHEASRTGAPIVALNIVRTLAETHNVITWIDEDGPLTDAFGEASTRVLINYGNPRDMENVLRRMQAEHGIAAALVSSVVSGLTLPALRLAGVPVMSLIHEFADYVAPKGKTSRMALYSDAAVFPAELVRAACGREMAALGLGGAAPDMMRIRPQGYNVARRDAEIALTPQDLYQVIDAPSDLSRCRIMFGAGWVQPRKGVDLFLQVAAALKDDPDYDWRFVWVGGNYRPETDMVVSIYLAHQVREAGLTSRMTFLPEQPSLEPFWEIADVFFMSSRLDPYPNVALEALYRSVPVVCYDGATGIADLGVDYPFAVRTVPFGDIEGAAREMRALLAPEVLDELTGPKGDEMREHLSFESYVSDLVKMIGPAQARAAAIDEKVRAFSAVNADDLALAARHMPPRLSLSSVVYPEILCRSLAEHADLLGLDVDETTGALLGAAGLMGTRGTGLRPWPAGGGMVQVPGAPDNTELVIHVPDQQAFDMLEVILAMLPTTSIPVQVVAGLPWLVAPLEALVKARNHPGVQVDARSALRAAEAATRHAAVDGPEFIAVISAVAEPDASRTPAAPEGGVLAALLSGAAEAMLTAEPDCSAVLGAMSLGHRSAAAEARAGRASPFYAPRFAGIYRRDILRAFARTGLPSDATGLDPADWDSLAALNFVRGVSESESAPGAAVMLPLLPLI